MYAECPCRDAATVLFRSRLTDSATERGCSRRVLRPQDVEMLLVGWSVRRQRHRLTNACLIWCRPLDAVDHEDVNRSLRRHQLQTKLFQ